MTYIEQLHEWDGKEVTLKGWVANMRESKGLLFIILRDGTGFCQSVVNLEVVGNEVFEAFKKCGLESAVSLTGKVVADERQIGGYELQVTTGEVYQYAQDYPIAKKEHGVEFLMDQRHLWLRSRKQWAIMRVRNQVMYRFHKFFQERGFVKMDAPFLTPNAAEGTSTLFDIDFYGRPAYLTQSGQLYGEAMAMAMGKIYTLGPTFRAEKSKTRRHLSEFWMLEPEIAFYDLEMNMDLIQEMISEVVPAVIENCQFELVDVLERDLSSFDTVGKTFPRLTYDEAVQILKGEKQVDGQNVINVMQADLEELKAQIAANEQEITEKEAAITAGGIKKGKLNWMRNKADQLKAENKELEEQTANIPQWIESAKNFKYGEDFGGSDETLITRLFDTPVMIYDWPAPIKAFYMKEVDGRPDLVRGVDVIAPEGFGEIVGGSQREDDLDILLTKIKETQLTARCF